jgi:hypothetical protein
LALAPELLVVERDRVLRWAPPQKTSLGGLGVSPQ